VNYPLDTNAVLAPTREQARPRAGTVPAGGSARRPDGTAKKL